MTYKTYHVRYVAPAGKPEEFIKRFRVSHFDEAKVPYLSNIGMPEDAALTLVNKWNQQTATFGFTYWIE